MRTKSKYNSSLKTGSQSYLLVPLIAACWAVPVYGDTDTWIDGTGNWSVLGNWSSGQIPKIGDDVVFTETDAVTRTVSLNVSSTLNSLTINSSGSGIMLLTQYANVLNVATEYVGLSGTGSLSVGGGTHTANTLYVGYNATSSGFFGFLGGTVNLTGPMYVGYDGTGSVNAGGSASIQDLYVGYKSGANGVYDSSYGGVNVNGNVYAGYSGTGVIYVGGGSTQISGNLLLGTNPGSSGTLNATSGSLKATNVILGQSGSSGNLNITAGAVTATQDLILNSGDSGVTLLGATTGPAGTLGGTLNVGSLNISANPAAFVWPGGTLIISGPNGLSLSASNFGPNLALPKTKSLIVANTLSIPAGNTVVVSGGTLSAGSLDASGNPMGLSWTAGTLAITGPNGLVPSASNIGQSVMIGTGQTLSISNTLQIPASSSVTLNGGTLSASVLDTSLNPTGFSWISGTLSLLNPAGVAVGAGNLGNNATVCNSETLLIRGALSIPVGTMLTLAGGTVSAQTIDTSGNPGGLVWVSGTLAQTSTSGLTLAATTLGTTLDIQSAQKLSVTGTLTVPTGASLTLDGGTVSANTLDLGGDPHRFIWNSGTLNVGSIIASSSTIGTAVSLDPFHVLTGSITVPQGANLTIDGMTGGLTVYLQGGNAVMNSGAISSVNIAASGTSTSVFTQIGGSLTGSLLIASGSASTDTFNLLSGSILCKNSSETIGRELQEGGSFTTATMNQSGGTNTLTGTSSTLIVGGAFNYPAPGVYNLRNGSVIVNAGSEKIGSSSAGTFNQSGGTNILTPSPSGGNLYIGDGGVGAYNLVDGMLQVGGTEAVGYSAAGTLNQTGGTNAPATLFLGGSGGSGTYNLSGGTVTAGNVYVGGNATAASGTGVLRITGGNVTIPGVLKIWNSSNSGVVYSGGSLTVGSIDLGTNIDRLTMTATTLSVTGASGFSVSFGNFAIDSNSTLDVAGPANFQIGATFSVGAATLNAGTIQVQSGGILNQTAGTVSTTSVSNSGVFTAANATLGSVSGAGSLTVNGTATASSVRQASVTVNAALNLIPNSIYTGVSKLVIGGAGKLDVTNDALQLKYTSTSPIGTVRQWIASAYADGTWAGPTGITSSTARDDSTSMTGLGYIESSDLIAAGVQSFRGIALIPIQKAVIVSLTSYGDTNLDGVVNAADFQRFLDGLATSGGTWEAGDFNYDGAVDLGNDFDLFLRGYLSQGNALGDLAPIVSADSSLSVSQKAQLLALVPEPTCAGMVPMAFVFFASRRRVRGGAGWLEGS
jgi:hypothetical protein